MTLLPVSRFIASALTTGVLALVAPTVHASYSVIIDDDLFPASVLEARNAAIMAAISPQSLQSEQYLVPFNRSQTLITRTSQPGLRAIIPAMIDAEILITGRPDAKPNARIARARAVNLRNYLVRRGIPRKNIVITTDNTPTFQSLEGRFASEIQIKRSATSKKHLPSTQSLVVPQHDDHANYVQVGNHSAATPSQAAPTSAQVMEYIINAVANGDISPEAGNKLLAPLIKTKTEASAKVAMVAVPNLQEVTFTLATQTKKPVWDVLETDATLQVTFARWSKVAGWSVVWHNVPEINVKGNKSLPDCEFLEAADLVLAKLKAKAQAQGFEITVVAHPDKVLVISAIKKDGKA